MRLLALPIVAATAVGAGWPPQPAGFDDDFEHGLSKWTIVRPDRVRTIDSGDPGHRMVLLLESDGDDVLALAGATASWRGVRFEGEVLFPTDESNYLGVAYHYSRTGDRADFGLIYIKGNDSYLQANPHRDLNVSRTLYPEYHTPLTGERAIVTKAWQRFRIEVVGTMCHFYVGDMTTPAMTFPHFEGRSGAVGLQPRSVGGPVWVDNVRATPIDGLSYDGPPAPAAFDVARRTLLTDWEVSGPFTAVDDRIARGQSGQWRPFPADARGAVVTSRVVDFHGPRTVAYFRTRMDSPAAGPAALEVSTVDDLAIWVNGRFHWFIARGDRAWFDFASNPQHPAQKFPVELRAGANEFVVRVRGGVYASGGFFARLVR